MTGYYGLMLAAFAGAGLCAFAVYRMAVSRGRAVVALLLLAGIAINALSGAFTGMLTYLSTNEQLRSITFLWLGRLGGASRQTFTDLLPFTILPVLLLQRLARSMHALSMGEHLAFPWVVRTGKVKM